MASLLYFTLLFIFTRNYVHSETIERNSESDSSPVSCTSFPCIINCNAATSCIGTISCPSSGTGDFTVNIKGDSAAESSHISCGSAQNVYLNGMEHRSFNQAVIDISSVSNDLIIQSDQIWSFHQAKITISGDVGHNIEFKISGNCYQSFTEGEFTVGNIGNDVTFQEDTGGTTYGGNFGESKININDVGGNVVFESVYHQYHYNSAFEYSTINIGSIGGSLSFLAGSGGAFKENTITVEGDITGDAIFTDTSDDGKGFTCTYVDGHITVNGNIGGSFQIIDQSRDGETGYGTKWTVTGNIGNGVSVRDESTGTGGGKSFCSSEFYFAYPSNTITGNVEFVEDSARGLSFTDYTKYYIGNVDGNAVFQTVNEIGTGAFEGSFKDSTIKITSVTGDLSFLCASHMSFNQNSITVTGNVDGNVLFKDTSEQGYCFTSNNYNFFHLNGNIGGSFQILDQGLGRAADGSLFVVSGNIGNGILLKDESTGPDGKSFFGSTFYFAHPSNTITGDVEFIEDSVHGASFDGSRSYFGSIDGNAVFQTADDVYESFLYGIFEIPLVTGDISFLSNSYYGFAGTTINVHTIGGDALFSAASNKGYDFYFTQINIEECGGHVSLQSTNPLALKSFGSDPEYRTPRISHFTFGSGVDLVDVQIEGGTNALFSTIIDAQSATEIKVTCDKDASCNDVDIKCPEDNQKNLCRVYCDETADCTNMNLFTTNGYCTDATFYCDSTDCSIDTTSKVFCTTGTTDSYGSTGTYCQMTSNEDNIYCDDVSPAQCSTEEVCAGFKPSPGGNKKKTKKQKSNISGYNNDYHYLSLKSPWIVVIGSLLFILLFVNLLLMCWVNCCNFGKRGGYQSVKYIDSETDNTDIDHVSEI